MKKKLIFIGLLLGMAFLEINHFTIAEPIPSEATNVTKNLSRACVRGVILIINTNLFSDQLEGYDYLQNVIENLLPNVKTEVMHYELVTPKKISSLKPRAIILGGQSTPWVQYPPKKLKKFFKTIRDINIPLLGICGGHQLLALSYGALVAPIKIIDESLSGYAGCWRERGYLPITSFNQDDPIFEGLQAEFVVFENHCDEVKTLPSDFLVIATGIDCKIQAIKHQDKPFYGVQFHPEGFTESFPDGKKIFQNFFTKICKL